MPWRSSDFFVALTISVAIFTDMFLYAVVVPVLPFSLGDRAGVADDDLQFWSTFLLTAYTSTFLVGSIVFGWATDQISKRSYLLFTGLFLMLSATFMLALSRTILLFTISRMLQGVAGAIVWSAGLALLLDTFGHARFGQMMAIAIICQTSALAVAPMVGGFVFAKLGYSAVMNISFAMVAVDIFLRLLLVEKPRFLKSDGDNSRQKDELIGPISPNSMTSPDYFPVTDQTPLLSKPVSKSISSWWAFVIIASCPRVFASLACFAGIWALNTSFDAVLPYKVHSLFGWSSTGSGLIFLPVVLPSFLAPIGDNFYNRWGAKKVTAYLFLLGIPAFASLAFTQNNDTINRVLLCAFLFFSGLVINLSIAPLTSDMTYAIQALERSHPEVFGEKGGYGRAFGLLNTAFALGGMVGPGFSGFVVAQCGWTTLCLGMSALCAVNVTLVLAFVGGGEPFEDRSGTS